MKMDRIGDQLALLGGSRTIRAPFNRYNPIGREELVAASAVIESGVLSKFIGSWEADFYGGPKVQAFERACESFFGVKHAVSVNSWTSGLIAAVGAAGIQPGDEVIVTPWTMSATATAILHWNAIPVFADIEPRTFSLDPESVEAAVSEHTRAILAVDIFGQSADMDALVRIARKHNLKVISDTAQAPGALYKGRYAGTIADIGGYSLNYHKHIHTGEGGIIVTDDDALAERARLIRNHAEAVVGSKGVTDLSNMIGFNFRLGEIEAAIGLEQLKKLGSLVERKQRAVDALNRGLAGLRGLRTPTVMSDCTHVYYIYGMILDIDELGVSRDHIHQALEAEGVTGLIPGYTNIHLLPMYQKKQAYGSYGFPWTAAFCRREVSYSKGICPVAEELHERTFLGFEICLHDLREQEVGLIVEAFQKVWRNLDKLARHFRT